jgi:hypothetical protein
MPVPPVNASPPEKKLPELDVAALFHSILFAYQKVLRDAAGETVTETITTLSVPVVREIVERASPGLLEGTPDDVLKRVADLLEASGFVRDVDIERNDQKYVLRCQGCTLAEHVHNMLKPKDVTCPWAIFMTAALQSASKRKVKVNRSEFDPSGSKTTIEFI